MVYLSQSPGNGDFRSWTEGNRDKCLCSHAWISEVYSHFSFSFSLHLHLPIFTYFLKALWLQHTAVPCVLTWKSWSLLASSPYCQVPDSEMSHLDKHEDPGQTKCPFKVLNAFYKITLTWIQPTDYSIVSILISWFWSPYCKKYTLKYLGLKRYHSCDYFQMLQKKN